MLCRANVYPMIGALCLLTSLCVVGLGPATASPAPSVCISAHPALTDVDGDGASDVVVGRPATSGSVVGAVDIHGTRSGSKVISGSGFTGASRAFGSSVVELRVDEDEFTCVDALVGDPGATGGGSVYLLRGTSAGLSTTSTRLTARTTGDRFGAAIAVGPGANADVWVGAPNRTVAGVREAGAVDHWTINDSGAATYLETITEASPVSHGVLTADAHFGAVLS